MSGRDSKQPYVRFFPSDWLAGTRGLSATETGIYITLICMMYERCEPVPVDEKRLARYCGCAVSTFKNTVQILIDEGKIDHLEAGFWNKRVATEFNFREKISTQRSEAAHARWDKNQQNQQQDNAKASPSQCEKDAIARVIPDTKEDTNVSSPPLVPPDKKPKNRTTRIPGDWAPSLKDIDYAKSKGLKDDEIRNEAELFKTYYEGSSGKGSTSPSWPAKWRTWVQNHGKWNGGSNAKPSSRAEVNASEADKYKRIVAEREFARSGDGTDSEKVISLWPGDGDIWQAQG